MKIASMLSVAVGAGIAVGGVLLLGSSQVSATPANGTAIAKIAQQIDDVTNAARRRRCPPDQKRDRHGYCVPNANL
jgi:hypothetical protein